MTTPKALTVLSVPARERLGTIELTALGEMVATPRGVQGMVERMARVRGWSPAEAFRNLNGWSNGYLQIVPALSVARVFDGLSSDTGEPRFDDDHPLIGETDRRERLAAYLRAGRPFLSTRARDVDRVDPSLGRVVPLSFRTDGTWIWTDTVTYYLQTHGLAPDPELVEHIVAHDHRCPEVDDATAERALQEMHGSSSHT